MELLMDVFQWLIAAFESVWGSAKDVFPFALIPVMDMCSEDEATGEVDEDE